MFADDLALCSELEEDLRTVMRHFVEVCRRRGLKINVGKSKVMVFSREEGLECEVCMDWMCLEHVSEFKYWDVFWTNEAQMMQSVVGRLQMGGR